MPYQELSEELVEELDEVMDSHEIRFSGEREELYGALVEAVRRDFALSGVKARGLTTEIAREQARLGARLAGRPRKGETAEEARMRRAGLDTDEFSICELNSNSTASGNE